MLKQCQKSQIREKRERALLKKVNAGDSNVGGTEKSGNPNWKGSEVEVIVLWNLVGIPGKLLLGRRCEHLPPSEGSVFLISAQKRAEISEVGVCTHTHVHNCRCVCCGCCG